MEIINVAPSVLKVHPRNQEFFDDIQGDEYERFEKSIAEDGILSALLVAPDMTIISGHQRYKAACELGFKTVPISIKSDIESEEDKTRLLLAANFGRLKNNPVKQAKVYKEYEALRGVGSRGGDRKSKDNNCPLILQEDIAKELGISLTQLKEIKRIGLLDPDLQELIISGKITPTTARRVLTKLTPEEQSKIYESLPKEVKLSQREVQEYVDQVIKERDEDIEGMVERIASANKEVRQKENEANLAKREAEAYKKKLTVKEQEIAGEFIAQRDKAVDAARKAQERYIQIKDEAEKAKGRLELVQKKLAEYESNAAPQTITDEISNLRQQISMLEKEKEELKNNIQPCAPDVDEVLRFLENTGNVMRYYIANQATLRAIEATPSVKQKIENHARKIMNSIDEMKNIIRLQI